MALSGNERSAILPGAQTDGFLKRAYALRQLHPLVRAQHLLCAAPARQELCHGRQMMVVMLCHNKPKIDQPHRRAESWMQRTTYKGRLVCPAQQVHQGGARDAKRAEQFTEILGVVVGLMGPAIREIARNQLWLARDQLLGPLQPERFAVQQVPHVLLDRPPITIPARERLRVEVPGTVLKSCRRSP